MKIAVTYENGNIFGHFGHTQQFKLYDVQDGKVVASLVVDTMGSGHGALAGDSDISIFRVDGDGADSGVVQREGAELLGEFLVRMAGFAVVFIIVFQRRLLRPRRGRKRQQRPQQQRPVQRASHSMKPSCFSHAISRS